MLKVDLKEILKANINTRPELLMYREWASNMILWEFIGDDLSFIMKDVDIGVKFSELNTDLLPIYYTMAGRIDQSEAHIAGLEKKKKKQNNQ